ncbi:IS110 family transposase, partial [Escherichia coli]|uniref:IS110 family transposase n=1 Tax=Escherichia coli TaxID=562 RepID=UPI000AB333D8
KCHVVRLNAKGELLERGAIRTGEMVGWLKRLEPSRVVMEACTQSPLMSRLAGRNHQAVVISSTLVRALGVGARGIKTDERDAEVLAKASLRNETLPSVHMRSEQATHQRAIVSARARLVRMRNQTSLTVKSYLRGRFIMLKGRASGESFCTAVRSVLEKTLEGVPIHIEVLLETFTFLTKQIEVLQEQIVGIADQSEVCKRLMTIPGVGPHVAVSF